jgi:outer membrane protein assembly factor BamB
MRLPQAIHCLFFFTASLLAIASLTIAAEPGAAIDTNWHQWRGPDATGVSKTANPPVTWSEDENIQWKVPIAGQGSSTPIVWKGKIFLVTAIDTGKVEPDLPPPDQQPERPFGIQFPNTLHDFVVLCLDLETGKELWRQTAATRVPHAGHHPDNNFASASPTTDGEQLYVWFGSVGMFCYDLAGKELWKRDFEEVETRLSFGEGSSPVVHDDKLILIRDNEGQSTIVVMNTKNGETIWEKERDEPSAWATPLVVEYEGKTQVITNAKNRVRSYNLADGSLIWECGGQVFNVTPSPVTDGTNVFCMSGYRGNALLAIPLSAQGDITGTEAIAWSKSRGAPYVPSPLLYEEQLYFTQSNDAILTSLDTESGDELIERTRLPGLRGIYTSPVAAAGRVYIPGRRGTTLVLEHGKEFKVLATNQLDEGVNSSLALVGERILLRGEKHLYCIGKSK